jgi:acyl-coenzyme A synthetase/AMP-(fatty) acid ligase
MAFVVAPGKSREEIQSALRKRIDPVFLPRPLVCVPGLPRNATGKLPREAVKELARRWLEKEAHGA